MGWEEKGWDGMSWMKRERLRRDETDGLGWEVMGCDGKG